MHPQYTTKRCSRCSETKPLDQFKKRKSTPDGHTTICKVCVNARESVRSKTKYANDTEYRERVKATSRVRMNAKYVHHPKQSVADRPEKQCPVCRLMLPREAYPKNRDKSDGLHDTCKICRNAARRERRQSDPIWRERTQAQQSERYHSRYKDRYNRQTSERYIADPVFREHAKAQARRGYRRNPQPFINRSRERTQALKLIGSFTQAEWEALCAYYNHRCLCCDKVKPLTRDHVIPISKGGNNYISNIQPLCETCNKSKGDKTIDYRTSRDADTD